MKNKKEISDLIRDNQHKLDERPSAATWKRLESKLDNRRSKGNTFLYRQIAMAAAVVALVAVISLITVVSDKQESRSQMAKVDSLTQVENWVMKDLETVYTDANTNVRMVVEFQKQLQGRYDKPIQEGTQTKKLLASNKTFTGSVNPPAGLAEEIMAMKERKKIEAIDLADVVVESSDEIDAKTKASRAKKPNILAKDYLSTIQKLEWIIGEWKENNIIHEIQKVNKSTIVCEDFILKDKRNIGLQFIDIKTQESFTLVSEENNKKVFSNKNSDRIILENEDSTKFTLLFLPSQGVKTKRTFTR